jgi:hypothetical protein
MKVDRRVAEESLQKKGFRGDRSKDHVHYYHQLDGRETGIKTWVSHSSKYKDIGPDNLKSMSRQLKLETTKQVEDLLKCPMTAEEYIAFLRGKNLLPE